MLFNLTTRKLFKCNRHELAIECNKECGPIFGDSELGASGPLNAVNKWQIRANRDGYLVNMDTENINMLTNQECQVGKYNFG